MQLRGEDAVDGKAQVSYVGSSDSDLSIGVRDKPHETLQQLRS